jgi:2-polyprenyl-3-methyl-5-hydroxy-6-metoxy-1,4-benzoquinol methylase
MMSQDPLEQLAQSWRSNAQAWTQAVRGQQIESRRLVTDAAIVQATLARRPNRVLDVGCGEGWLCRVLAAHGIEAVGVDASAPLIDAARAAGGAAYHVLAYADLVSAPDQLGHFDAVVCNFALLEADLSAVLAALRPTLRAGGVLLIQSVHPWTARGEAPYRDGWRTETFAGFGAGFTDPMPWFYRTLESWVASLRAAGWRIEELGEPLHPQTGHPASLLLVASPAGA